MTSDIFGIGAGIRSVISIFLSNARGTGRTTFLVNGLRNGDLVIVSNENTGSRIERAFMNLESRRGERIHWKVVKPGNFHEIRFNPNNRGRLVFDHVWVELTYKQAVEDVEHKISQIQKHASGPSSKPMKEMDLLAIKIDDKYKGDWKIDGKYKGDWLL